MSAAADRKHAPRIRMVRGEWYAFGKHGRCARLLLVPAITFCRRLNGAAREVKP